jgi:hypothetical protein
MEQSGDRWVEGMWLSRGRACFNGAMHDALIDRLAATPKSLAHLIAEATDAQFDAAAPAGWSARTVLAHLRDLEFLEFRLAAERVLAEEAPTFAVLDADAWERARNRTRHRKEQLLADFALQRQASVSILRMLRADDRARTGSARGTTFTLARLVEGWAGHDEAHIAQLEGLLGETVAAAIDRRRRAAEG